MKVLKIIGAIVLVIVVVLAIAALLGPKGIKMERSIVIHAPRSLIFNNIADYRNFQKWSPWTDIDSNCKYEFTGPQGQADAGFKWSGNDKVGVGEMHTTEIAQDYSMVSQMKFLKPWNSKAKTTFTLDSVGPGDVKVTWGFEQSFRIRQRPIMLFMNMEKMLAPDYEKGLAKMKAVDEAEAAAPAYKVTDVKWLKKTYVAYRTKTSFDSLSAVFQSWMPKVYAYVTANKLEMDGAPTGLYFLWDTEKKQADMAIAIPVKKTGKVSGDYTAVTVDNSNASTVDYYGPYDNMTGAHTTLKKYVDGKGLKMKPPVIEEYVTDPGTEKDPKKVLTKIYYLTD